MTTFISLRNCWCAPIYFLRRYAWRQSPCQRLEACAIYSVENQLPAPPFIYNGLIQ